MANVSPDAGLSTLETFTARHAAADLAGHLSAAPAIRSPAAWANSGATGHHRGADSPRDGGETIPLAHLHLEMAEIDATRR